MVVVGGHQWAVQRAGTHLRAHVSALQVRRRSRSPDTDTAWRRWGQRRQYTKHRRRLRIEAKTSITTKSTTASVGSYHGISVLASPPLPPPGWGARGSQPLLPPRRSPQLLPPQPLRRLAIMAIGMVVMAIEAVAMTILDVIIRGVARLAPLAQSC